jgi:hypothetical protein
MRSTQKTARDLERTLPFKDHSTFAERPAIKGVMASQWPQLRYWTAISVSLVLALVMPGGLAMGGPADPVGWAALVVTVVSPLIIWWTRWDRAAAVVQYGYLMLVAGLLGWALS